MYIGRFVVLGKTSADEWYLGYRVSSRSFPNRYISVAADRAMVLPTPDAARSDNPYISYNCLRTHEQSVVVGNGSQVDPIIDKVKIGYGLRDAISLSLLALDYEHDAYNTPRVVAALGGRQADGQHAEGFLGLVAEDKLQVRRLSVAAGQAFLIATYELTDPTPIALQGSNAEELVQSIFECEYELPVTALVALPTDQGLRIAARSAR